MGSTRMGKVFVVVFVSCGLPVAMASFAAGATANFEISPTAPQTGSQITVAPGEQISYQVTVAVSSGDNQGLHSFVFDIVTDFGIAIPSADEFDPLIEQHFPLLPSLGSPSVTQPGTLLQVAAFQQLGISESTLTGVGQSGPQVLVRGRLTAPSEPGQYTVRLDNVYALVIVAGKSAPVQADADPGQGFTVTVTEQGEDGGGLPGEDGSEAVPACCGTGSLTTAFGLLAGWVMLVTACRRRTGLQTG